MARSVKSQTGKSALLLGYGYVARALAPSLIAMGYEVTATRRAPQAASRPLENGSVRMLAFDGEPSKALIKAVEAADLILSSVPPSQNGDPVAGLIAKHSRAKWIGYLSATSVYGDRAGQWAFEEEKLYPLTDRGRRRIFAELDWLETGMPVRVFRLAGIYGPEIDGMSRNPFSRVRSGKARAIIKPGHVVNRIHVQDIASALLASMDSRSVPQIFNLADGSPAPPQDVLRYAADLMGVAAPEETDPDDPNLSDMARSFYLETKRIDSSRAVRELGWRPEFPDYKTGLSEIYARDFANSKR